MLSYPHETCATTFPFDSVPKAKEAFDVQAGRRPAIPQVRGFNPLLAPSHEELAAEAGAHLADEDDETTQKCDKQFQHHTHVTRTLERWMHIEWRTHHCRARREACVRGRGRNADHTRIDTVSVHDAFIGERDQTAKTVLILRHPDDLAVADPEKYHPRVCLELCPLCNDCSGFRAAIGWCHKLRKLLGPAVAAELHFPG